VRAAAYRLTGKTERSQQQRCCALAVAAIAFVFWFLPETKALPVEEIARVFERQRRPAARTERRAGSR